MRSLPSRIARAPRALLVLLVVAALHGTAWAVVVAPLNGPDEADHASYVQRLAETGHGPQTETGNAVYSDELSNLLGLLGLAPLYGNRDARPTFDRVDDVSDLLDDLPERAKETGEGPNPVAKNPPLYYAYGSVVYLLAPDRSLLSRLFLIRMATVLLFVAMVAVAWKLAGELFGSTWAQTVMTAVVALQPKLGATAGSINPDMLLALLSTVALLAGVRIARHGPTAPRLLAGALAAGGAVATQGRGFAVVPIVGAAVLVGLWRFRPSVRTGAPLLAAFGAALMVPVVGAFLYTRAHTAAGAFGGEVTQATERGFSVVEWLVNVWQFYLPQLPFMVDRLGPSYGYRQMYITSFFGEMGALEITFSAATLGWVQLAAGLGLIALFGCVVRRWEAVRARWPELLVLLTAFVGLMALLHMAAYRDLARGAPDPLITGRYLMPVVAVYAAAVTVVVRSVPRTAGAVLGGLIVGAHAAAALSALGIALERTLA